MDLDLRNKKLTSIEFMRDDTQTTRLQLGCNRIADLSPLENNEYVTHLFIDNNKLTDISILGSMRSLVELHAQCNKITTINFYLGFWKHTLTHLVLIDNMITDITPAKELGKLEYLSISGNHAISSIEPLRDLKFLQDLSIRYTNVSDLSPLSSLPNLTHLDADGCPISDISFMKNNNHMEWLNLRDTLIEDASALSGNDTIESLSLGKYIRNLDFMIGNTTIGTLDIMVNENLNNIDPLKDTMIHTLLTFGTPITDFSPLYHNPYIMYVFTDTRDTMLNMHLDINKKNNKNREKSYHTLIFHLFISSKN